MGPRTVLDCIGPTRYATQMNGPGLDSGVEPTTPSSQVKRLDLLCHQATASKCRKTSAWNSNFSGIQSHTAKRAQTHTQPVTSWMDRCGTKLQKKLIRSNQPFTHWRSAAFRCSIRS